SYDRALEIRRSYSEAALAKAEVCLERGDVEGARRGAAQALEIDPDSADAEAIFARSSLREVRGGRVEAIAEGRAHVARSLAIDPRSYDARVTDAELSLEEARATGNEGALDRALAALEEARALDGCQNRVLYLTACALLARAKSRSERGADARAD